MADHDIPVIAIDGPSGSGKGTVSQLLARALQWHLLDSGALYRVLALAAIRHSVDCENALALEVLGAHLDVQFIAKSLGDSPRIILEGTDVSDAIRTSDCGQMASIISAIPEVRNALLARQRAFREMPGLVADGRDMGSIVFPEAKLKVFLEASLSTRAERRYTQLQEKGISVSLERVLTEIAERDKRDIERAVAPLVKATDAWCLDTTCLTVQEVFTCIMQKVQACFSHVLTL